jgi:hypothetical protein
MYAYTADLSAIVRQLLVGIDLGKTHNSQINMYIFRMTQHSITKIKP